VLNKTAYCSLFQNDIGIQYTYEITFAFGDSEIISLAEFQVFLYYKKLYMAEFFANDFDGMIIRVIVYDNNLNIWVILLEYGI
jgi:hypothetical protein